MFFYYLCAHNLFPLTNGDLQSITNLSQTNRRHRATTDSTIVERGRSDRRFHIGIACRQKHIFICCRGGWNYSRHPHTDCHKHTHRTQGVDRGRGGRRSVPRPKYWSQTCSRSNGCRYDNRRKEDLSDIESFTQSGTRFVQKMRFRRVRHNRV